MKWVLSGPMNDDYNSSTVMKRSTGVCDPLLCIVLKICVFLPFLLFPYSRAGAAACNLQEDHRHSCIYTREMGRDGRRTLNRVDLISGDFLSCFFTLMLIGWCFLSLKYIRILLPMPPRRVVTGNQLVRSIHSSMRPSSEILLYICIDHLRLILF